MQALEAAKRLSVSSETATGQQESGWEIVVEKKDFRVWKRPIPNSHLYEYRGQLVTYLSSFVIEGEIFVALKDSADFSCILSS